MPPCSSATPGGGHRARRRVGTEAGAPPTRPCSTPRALRPAPGGQEPARLRPARRSLPCEVGTQTPRPPRDKQRRQGGGALPVQGLLPLGVLDAQRAQDRVHQRLVLEDDPPEAVQERHRGGRSPPRPPARGPRGASANGGASPARPVLVPPRAPVRRPARCSAPEVTRRLPGRAGAEGGAGGRAATAPPKGWEDRGAARSASWRRPADPPPRLLAGWGAPAGSGPGLTRPGPAPLRPAIPPAAAGRHPTSARCTARPML